MVLCFLACSGALLTPDATVANEITLLGGDVARVTKPSKYSKNDLAPWRALFELYLEAQIFYSTQERDHGVREAANARRQLDWFENEARKRQLTGQFQLPTSAAAYARFILLNRRMLRNFNLYVVPGISTTRNLAPNRAHVVAGLLTKAQSRNQPDGRH